MLFSCGALSERPVTWTNGLIRPVWIFGCAFGPDFGRVVLGPWLGPYGDFPPNPIVWAIPCPAAPLGVHEEDPDPLAPIEAPGGMDAAPLAASLVFAASKPVVFSFVLSVPESCLGSAPMQVSKWGSIRGL